MKLSKLIRDLSTARDNLKIDPEVEIYSHLRTQKGLIVLKEIGTVKAVKYINNPDNIRLICD